MTDLDRKFQEVRRNEPPDLWSSIGTRLPVEPVSAPRRRWPVLVVAILVGIGGLAFAWEGFRDKPAQVAASAPVVTSPAPRQCPWGLARVSAVSTEQFLLLTNGRGPTWLPKGFGLAQTWSDHADWSDGTCREVTMSVYRGTQAPPRDVLGSVGDWLVVVDARGSCGNAILGPGRCLDYVAPTRDGLTFGLQMMGIGRPVGDRIALSISLEAGPSTHPPTVTQPVPAEFSFAEAAALLAERGMSVKPVPSTEQQGLLDRNAFDHDLEKWTAVHGPDWRVLSTHLGLLDFQNGHFNFSNRASYFVEIHGPRTGNCFYFFDATDGQEFLGACFYPARS
jgi:hypothetical protein